MTANNQAEPTSERYDIVRKIVDICFNNGGVTKPMADKLADYVEEKMQEAALKEHRIMQNQAFNVLKTAKAVGQWSELRVDSLERGYR